MKLCQKCGAHNADEKTFCIDCAEYLGDPLSAEEEEQIRLKTRQTVDHLYNEEDPLGVSRFDKIIIVLAVLGLVLMLVKTLFGYFVNSVQLAIYGFIAFAAALETAALPKIGWAITKMKLSLHFEGAEFLSPSILYRGRRKIASILFLVSGAVCLLCGMLL